MYGDTENMYHTLDISQKCCFPPSKMKYVTPRDYRYLEKLSFFFLYVCQGQTFEKDIIVSPSLTEYIEGTESKKREFHASTSKWKMDGGVVKIPYITSGLGGSVYNAPFRSRHMVRPKIRPSGTSLQIIHIIIHYSAKMLCGEGGDSLPADGLAISNYPLCVFSKLTGDDMAALSSHKLSV
jgi:hypothetical protein